MKKLIAPLLLLSLLASAQMPDKAEQLLMRKNRFRQLAEQYRQGKTGGDYANILQSLAITYAELNQKDSALYFLNASLNNCPIESKDCDEILSPNIVGYFQFKQWRSDPEWQKFEMKMIKAFERKNTTIKNRQFAYDILVRCGKEQSYKQYEVDLGLNSNLQKELQRVDSANVAFIKQAIRYYGYPGRSMVGETAAATAFEWIQHADNDVAFQKEALEKMKQLPKGEVEANNIAYLTDRIMIKEKGRQVFGTQFKDFNSRQLYPILDSAHVDVRRKEMGLSTLAEYMNSFMAF